MALIDFYDVINFSSGGKYYEEEEFKILTQIGNKGTKIVVSAGNNGQDLNSFNYFPAKYNIKNLIPVGSLNEDGRISPSSNYGLENEVYEIGNHVLSTLPSGNYGYMSGTSQATAIKTNKILLELCKKNEKTN